MAARSFALLAVFVTACSSSGTTSVDRGPDGASEGIVGRRGPLATATAVSSGPASPTSSGVPTDVASPAALARAALDLYVDALVSQTFGRALAASDGAARRVALVRLVLAEHNRTRGASTTVAVLERAFTPAVAEASRVRFKGAASLRSSVSASGGTGSESSVRRLADPVVERKGSRWLVTSFSWDGRPIVAHDGRGVGSHDGVEFRLEGSIAFGEVVGVLVLLFADGPRSVRIEADRLRAGGAESASGFRTLIAGQPGLLYLTYPRRDERPVSWRASVVVDGGAAGEVSLVF